MRLKKDRGEIFVHFITSFPRIVVPYGRAARISKGNLLKILLNDNADFLYDAIIAYLILLEVGEIRKASDAYVYSALEGSLKGINLNREITIGDITLKPVLRDSNEWIYSDEIEEEEMRELKIKVQHVLQNDGSFGHESDILITGREDPLWLHPTERHPDAIAQVLFVEHNDSFSTDVFASLEITYSFKSVMNVYVPFNTIREACLAGIVKEIQEKSATRA